MPIWSSLFAELKRRHVWRVAIAYAVVGWLLIQIATQVFPFFGIPSWAVRLAVLLIVFGFPLAVLLAWVFDLTPAGIRRTESMDLPGGRTAAPSTAVRRNLNAVIIVGLATAVALLLANTFVWHEGMHRNAVATSPASAPAPRAIPTKSIAVLPFANLSDDKKNEYFVAGMQDLILTKLADIGSLKVISQTSTRAYGSRPENLTQVAAELGVATVLEGSVQKQGDQVLISVQLIDAKSDAHLWAESYTRTLDNIFGVEGEVAGKIASALNAKLSPAQSARLADWPTTSQAAYDLFLRAEYQANLGVVNGDMTGWKAAVSLYREAVTQDPKFALAWARLSYTESRMAFDGGGSSGVDVAELNRQARADADEAARLQPKLPATQLALGYCAYYGRRDYAAALQAFAAALATRPNDADALAAQAYVQRRQGHFDAAIASLTRSVTLDPRNFTPTLELGNTYMMVRRYAEANTWFLRALALEPDSAAAKIRYADAITLGSGDVARALAAVQGDTPNLKQQRASLLAYQRKFSTAIALLETIPDTPDHFGGGSRATAVAQRYWQAGDKAHARQLFAQALPRDRATLAQMQGKVTADAWARTRGIVLADAWARVAIGEIGTGDVTEGLAAIAKSQAIVAKTPDAVLAPEYTLFDAAAVAMAGRADLAVPLLSKVLDSSGGGEAYSPVLLWLDPIWDSIHDAPGFQALLRKYAKFKPAITYTAALASSGASGATR